MSSAIRQHGPAWARGALHLGLRTALGPDFAEVALAQGAMLLALAPAYVHRARDRLAA